MSPPAEQPRGRSDHGVSFLRRHREFLALIALIVLGASLGFASLQTEVSQPYAQPFTGIAPQGNETLTLPQVALVSYIQVNLTQGGCGLRVYPANAADAFLFNDTGRLPNMWLSCNNRTATVGGDTVALILVNTNATATPYRVDTQAILVQTPYAWLALPGMVLALAGVLGFVPRFVMHLTLRSWGGPYEKRRKK